jgi:hypothetical protein
LGKEWIRYAKEGHEWAVQKNWLEEEPSWWWKISHDPFLPKITENDRLSIILGRQKYLVNRWKKQYPLFSRRYKDYLQDLAFINN